MRLNYREIEQYESPERLIRDHVIRGEIVRAYTLVDEFLNALLCNHFSAEWDALIASRGIREPIAFFCYFLKSCSELSGHSKARDESQLMTARLVRCNFDPHRPSLKELAGKRYTSIWS
ncbi:MAG TPA: hypothetical protein VKS44_15390 [Candidatus Acidoferrales bacterium]|nr:hypothetical protein [Candidatus Acidoferrales bacterium]